MASRPTVHVVSTIKGLRRVLETHAECKGIPFKFHECFDDKGHWLKAKDFAELSKQEISRGTIVLGEPTMISQMYDLGMLQEAKWVQSTWAGADHIIKAIPNQPNFALTRLAGVFGPAMAEYVVGQIIARERGFETFMSDQKAHFWRGEERALPYRLLDELSIAILGLGDIGSCIATACKALGMRVVGVGRRERQSSEIQAPVDSYCTLEQVSETLNTFDYVCNVMPSTNLTRDLLSDKKLWGGMEGDSSSCCVFINVGRGDVISQNFLIQALDVGLIHGAILDVLPIEPLPEDNPLWDHPSVRVTPHVSCLSLPSMVATALAKNYEAFTNENNDKELSFQVSWGSGY